MALLNYDIRVVGLQAVNRALRSVERRVAALNRRQSRGLGGTGAAKRGGGSMAAEMASRRTMSQRIIADETRTQSRLRQVRQRGNRQRVSDARRSARQEARVRAREERRGARGGGGTLRGRTMGRTGQSLRSGMRAVGTVGAGLLAIGGGYALSSAIGQEKRLQATSAALANQARGTVGGGGKSFAQLQGEATRTARVEGLKSGQGPEAVIGGMRQFQAITGRFDIAQKMTGYMTELADATDAGLGDVGRTAGQIFQAIEAKGTPAAEAMEATMKIMDAMAGQSKIGSIEMGDLAQQMGKLMSATANFKGDVGELAADMGAMAQTAIAGGASSATEAMTALLRFADDLVQKGAASPVYKRAGIDVFNREDIGGGKVRTSLKSPVELIKQIVGGTKGDIAKISSMFGVRAKKAVDPFARIYREAEQKKAGTGIEAIEKRFKQFRDVSLTAPQRKEAAENRRQQADRQFDMAMQKFNDAIGRELLPVVTRLVPKFVELIPLLTKGAEALGKFISWFAENPMTGIGAIIAASMVKDIAAAGIGAAMRAAMGLGGGGPGGGGGLGGAAPALAVAGVGAAVWQAGELAKDQEQWAAEAALDRDRVLTGVDENVRVERERSLADRLREGVYKPSDLWDKEEVWRDERGRVRSERTGGGGIKGQYEETWAAQGGKVRVGASDRTVATQIANRQRFDERRDKWDLEEQQLEATTTGTGERHTEAAAEKTSAAADKLTVSADKLAVAADKLSTAEPNRGASPSPTVAR